MPSDLEYKKIHLEGLQLNSIINFSLYTRTDAGTYTLYKASDSRFLLSDKERLVRNSIAVYIHVSSLPEYNKYTVSEITNILTDKTIPLAVKGRILYQVSADYIEEVFSMENGLETTQRHRYLVEQIVSLWLSDPMTLSSVTLLNCHSDYEYRHSVQVASVCIILGSLCYDLTRFELIDLGIGGLLHDFGKIHVPKEILEKPAGLTEVERTIVKRHPMDGYNYLKSEMRLDETVLSMIKDHHEAIDGTGYPKGLLGDQLGRNARISSIADIFCALISDRSYRKAFTQLEAVRLMRRDFSKKLDTNILYKLEQEILKRGAKGV